MKVTGEKVLLKDQPNPRILINYLPDGYRVEKGYLLL